MNRVGKNLDDGFPVGGGEARKRHGWLFQQGFTLLPSHTQPNPPALLADWTRGPEEGSPASACYPLPYEVTLFTPKIRRGGYVFIAWKGDHTPRHVHVYRDGRLVLKWDLDNGSVMKGRASGRLRKLIGEIEAEGLL